MSAETIYSYLYVLPRNELRRELLTHLRQHRKNRRPHSRGLDRRGQIQEIISIDERPPNGNTNGLICQYFSTYGRFL